MTKKVFSSDDDMAMLGTITHYNGILFGNLFAEQADCEGALAVGGSAELGSPGHGYDVGAASVPGWGSVVIGNYENPEGYPSFLLGGEVTPQSISAQIYGGPVVLREGYRQQYESGSFRFGSNDVRYAQDADIAGFFAHAKERFARTGQVLFDKNARHIPLSGLADLTALDQNLYMSQNIDTEKRILVYTILCGEGDSLAISDIGLGGYVSGYDMIVINAAAGQISFGSGAVLYNGSIVNTSVPRIYPGNELLAMLASKIVFNFPNATAISLENYGLIGSLIAPNAMVTGAGGSINGMLAAGSLNQKNGKELHAFTLPLGEELLSLALKADPAGLAVHKTDAETAQALAGAQFVLYEYDEGQGDVAASGVTGENGTLVFERLAPGCYLLKETVPPPGYQLPAEHEWIIDLTN